jgi:predicted nucleic acid-binding protein
MGWHYPKSDSLENNIEKYKLYPITVLQSLAKAKAQTLMREKIVTAHQVCDVNISKFRRTIGVSEAKARQIIAEANAVCEK